MVTQKQKETREGVVIEAFPNTLFKVRFDPSGEELLTYLAGKMRLHRIRILIGDRVTVELDGYQGSKGKIIRRL